MPDDIVARLQERPAKWDVVKAARPTVIKSHPVRHPAKRKSGWQRAIIFGDAQVGYRRKSDGTMESFHDPAAMDLVLALLSYEQAKGGVDVVASIGDMIDAPGQSRWAQEPGFAQTTQRSIDRLHDFLAATKANAPDAKHYFITGNHCERLMNSILLNMAASYGIKRAKMKDELPVMDLGYLLRLGDLDIEYVSGYPNERVWLTSTLALHHGDKVRSAGSTASAYVQANPTVSRISGHIHRQELQHRTVEGPGGKAVRAVAASPGCLCKTTGAVPSVGSSLGPDGGSMSRTEAWQQGVCVVDFHTDGRFVIHLIPIINGWMRWDGTDFHANPKAPE